MTLIADQDACLMTFMTHTAITISIMTEMRIGRVIFGEICYCRVALMTFQARFFPYRQRLVSSDMA